jgi:N-methylhydantoinase A
MITGSGARIGFITTAGHRDALPIMRIIGRSAGRSETELKQYTYTDKPAPIVPKTRIKEV